MSRKIDPKKIDEIFADFELPTDEEVRLQTRNVKISQRLVGRELSPTHIENSRQGLLKKWEQGEYRSDEAIEKIREAMHKRHQDPEQVAKIKKGQEKFWNDESRVSKMKKVHKKAVREAFAVPETVIKEIFNEYHNDERDVDDKTFKESMCKKHNISKGHINKICMGRSPYVRDVIGLSQSDIIKLREQWLAKQPTYSIISFGVDRMHYYKDYSFRSKFSVELVWECRFGKYKGLTRKPLSEALGIPLTRDDADSFKKSYSWLTNKNSEVLFTGNREETAKHCPTPTREEKVRFIKTGKYQGCMVVINE